MSTISQNPCHKNVIFLYQDAGVSKKVFLHTKAMVEAYCGKHFILRGITAKQIKESEWEKTAILLIIPGGADLPYVKKLNGIGNERIRAFVESGGGYLGICAGGYYGSANVIFEKGKETEVTGPRELKLFKGNAIGSHLAPFCKASEKGTRAGEITGPEGNGHLYFNGGCYFDSANQMANTKVLGVYQDKKAAIIHTKVGSGSAILSGVHFEVDFRDLDCHNLYLQDVIPLLAISESFRASLVRKIFTILGILYERKENSGAHASHQQGK